ncbi:MAG: UvrD-helicase domain-containing protein, partial [Novosphingobium sp.]|nr:UvrD-helicase domain-containing protein [Novosphingobium sp.]
MSKEFTPSRYQSAVYENIQSGSGNIVIDAVAGSGKSTTIVNALKLIPENYSVLFLAFNKAIVEELKLKIGYQSNVEVKTLHSLGAGSVMRTFKSQLDNSKYRRYISDAIKFGSIKPTFELEEEEILDYRQNIYSLVDLCRAYLCNDVKSLFTIAGKYLINVIDNEVEMALNVVSWGKNNTTKIDFTDMIFLPNVKKLDMPKFDYVFIDECQDLNTAQRELFLQTLKPTGRFIAVGDPRQAIYGFAGADVESFNVLKSLPNTKLLPLSVCYRCDAEIINLAKSIVPQIESKDNAESGNVNRDAKITDIQDGDMILCRVTAPLVGLCMNYI